MNANVIQTMGGLKVSASTSALLAEVSMTLVSGKLPKTRWPYGDVTVEGIYAKAWTGRPDAVMPTVLFFEGQHANGAAANGHLTVTLDGNWININHGKNRLPSVGINWKQLKAEQVPLFQVLAPLAGLKQEAIEKAIASVNGKGTALADPNREPRVRLTFKYEVVPAGVGLTLKNLPDQCFVEPGAANAWIVYHLVGEDRKTMVRNTAVTPVEGEIAADGKFEVVIACQYGEGYELVLLKDNAEVGSRKFYPRDLTAKAEVAAPEVETTQSKPSVERLEVTLSGKTAKGSAFCQGGEKWFVLPAKKTAAKDAVAKGNGPEAAFEFESKDGAEYRIVFKVGAEAIEASFTLVK